MKTNEMDANDYQRQTRLTAVYPKEKALEYLGLGVCGEAGEVAGKIKKLIRDGSKDTPDERAGRLDAIAEELGDVLWYVAELATELGVTIKEIMYRNNAKLRDRANRGVLQGSGDKR